MTHQPEKGTRGFELDIHVAFRHALPEAGARAALLALEGFTVDLYRPHPNAMPAEVTVADAVPSARLNGPLRDAAALREGLAALLDTEARYIEVGVRGFLRSSTGQTEWMPWRKNVVLGRGEVDKVSLEEGVRFVLE